MLRALIAAGSGDAAMLLGATPTLRTPPAARAELGKLLGAARPPELLFGLLLAHGQLLQLLRPKKVPRHAGATSSAHSSRGLPTHTFRSPHPDGRCRCTPTTSSSSSTR